MKAVYIKRAIEDTVLRLSGMFPVLLVTGRQDDAQQQLIRQERRYMTLDNPDARYLVKREPALFMQRYAPPASQGIMKYRRWRNVRMLLPR